MTKVWEVSSICPPDNTELVASFTIPRKHSAHALAITDDFSSFTIRRPPVPGRFPSERNQVSPQILSRPQTSWISVLVLLLPATEQSANRGSWELRLAPLNVTKSFHHALFSPSCLEAMNFLGDSTLNFLGDSTEPCCLGLCRCTILMATRAARRCGVCNCCENDELLMLCDSASHTYCAGLGAAVPEGGWFCEDCAASKEEHSRG
jgi:hypothetical protein